MGEPTEVNAERDLLTPHPDRLVVDHPRRAEILAAHERAVDRGDGGYRDPASGLFVMTASWLAARSSCCGNGCRHCPYC